MSKSTSLKKSCILSEMFFPFQIPYKLTGRHDVRALGGFIQHLAFLIQLRKSYHNDELLLNYCDLQEHVGGILIELSVTSEM